jgi:hypothetical protein
MSNAALMPHSPLERRKNGLFTVLRRHYRT